MTQETKKNVLVIFDALTAISNGVEWHRVGPAHVGKGSGGGFQCDLCGGSQGEFDPHKQECPVKACLIIITPLVPRWEDRQAFLAPPSSGAQEKK